MKFENIIHQLKNYTSPQNPSLMFVLPEDCMKTIYDHIIRYKLSKCIELGTGYGTTACVMATAVQELNIGFLAIFNASKVLSIDKLNHEIKGVDLRTHIGLSEKLLEFIVEPLGYNWYLYDLIQKNKNPIFDFCFIDGSHEFEQDALAFVLVDKLLKPGGWIVFDDMNWNLRMFPDLKNSEFANYSDRELDTFQVKMVYDLLVRQNSEYDSFYTTNNGKLGWARKKIGNKAKDKIV